MLTLQLSLLASSCCPHHPHPLSQFYAIHCRPISSVDMTREKSQNQSRESQKPVSSLTAAVLYGSTPGAYCDEWSEVSNGLNFSQVNICSFYSTLTASASDHSSTFLKVTTARPFTFLNASLPVVKVFRF